MLKKLKVTDLIIIFLIAFAYLGSRLINLGILPIFTDEAIYLRWSQIMAHDPGLRYLPLVDGKPPLFMWLTMIVFKVLPALDPVISGRLVSVGAGLFGLMGVFFTSFVLFKNKKLSYLSTACYLFSPFAFFYDRMAMADSLLAALFIWAFGLGVLLVKTIRLDVAMILGITVGLGRLTKTPAIFSLILSPLFLIFKPKSFLKAILLFGLAYAISEVMFSILRLFPLFNMIGSKNAEFTISISQFLKQPFGLLIGNLKSLVSWEYFYLTFPVTLALIYALFIGLKKNPKETLVLIAGFLIPVISIASFNKVIYPRYLLTFTPPLLILVAYGLSRVNKLALIIFLWPVFTILGLLTNPVKAPLLQADRDQYIDGWAAGFGVKEIREYLKGKTGIIATEGTFGLMPYSLELYQKDYPNVQIKPYWPLPSTAPAGTNFVILYQHSNLPEGWKVEEIMSFRQGLGKDYLRLFKVL